MGTQYSIIGLLILQIHGNKYIHSQVKTIIAVYNKTTPPKIGTGGPDNSCRAQARYSYHTRSLYGVKELHLSIRWNTSSNLSICRPYASFGHFLFYSLYILSSLFCRLSFNFVIILLYLECFRNPTSSG